MVTLPQKCKVEHLFTDAFLYGLYTLLLLALYAMMYFLAIAQNNFNMMASFLKQDTP